MTTIHYALDDGSTVTLDISDGVTIRDAALDNGVSGIEGDCGGVMNCATCHVYVGEEWLPLLPDVSELEDEMLDGAAAERLANSRLSCQLPVRADWDGCTVRVPDTQY